MIGSIEVERINLYFGVSPLPVRVTTRIITFLVGNPYKPSFATVTGRGDNPKYKESTCIGLEELEIQIDYVYYIYISIMHFQQMASWWFWVGGLGF